MRCSETHQYSFSYDMHTHTRTPYIHYVGVDLVEQREAISFWMTFGPIGQDFAEVEVNEWND